MELSSAPRPEVDGGAGVGAGAGGGGAAAGGGGAAAGGGGGAAAALGCGAEGAAVAATGADVDAAEALLSAAEKPPTVPCAARVVFTCMRQQGKTKEKKNGRDAGRQGAGAGRCKGARLVLAYLSRAFTLALQPFLVVVALTLVFPLLLVELWKEEKDEQTRVRGPRPSGAPGGGGQRLRAQARPRTAAWAVRICVWAAL